MIRICLLLIAALLLAPAVMAQTCGPIANHVVINEVVYDVTPNNPDDLEYVELYNPTNQPIDLTDWYLQGLDEVWTGTWPPMAGAQGDDNPDYQLIGIIPPQGYFVAGSAFVIGQITPGPTVATQILTHPLSGASLDLWENGNPGVGGDSIVLRDTLGAAIDSFTYEANKGIGPNQMLILEGPGVWGNYQNVAGIGDQSLARWVDGLDTDNNGSDFGQVAITPGAPNVTAPVSLGSSTLPMFSDFNSGTPDTAIAQGGAEPTSWSFSFQNAHWVDPGVTGTNPNVIPYSPSDAVAGSGLAAVFWDQSGGGNSVNLQMPPSQDAAYECFVYLETANPTGACVSNEHETWSIGLRGSTGTLFNTFLPGTAGAANGNTGINWSFERYVDTNPGAMQAMGTLSLVDENDGGDDEVILVSIPIIAGVNDGWQRIKLNLVGDVIDAAFGGTHGLVGFPSDNANPETRVRVLTDTVQCGTMYLGYREYVCNNLEGRPPTLDDLVVGVSGSGPSFFFGTPLLFQIDQPLGPGSLRAAHRGLNPGQEVFSAITVNEPAPGGPGTGPFLGLFTTDLFQPGGIIEQVNLPLGSYPFHFSPTSSSITLGPLSGTGLPAGLIFEALSFEFAAGIGILRVSDVTAVTLQ